MTTMRDRCKRAIMRSDAWSSFFDDEAAGVFADAVLDELANPSEAMVEAAFGMTYSGFQQSCMDRSARRAAVVRTGDAFTAAIRAAKDGK